MSRPVVNLKVNEQSYLLSSFKVRSGISATKTKNFDQEEPLIIAGIANRHEEDRMREVVDPGGVDLRAFENNSVLLFQHNHNEAIGTVTRMHAEEDGLHFEAKIGDPRKAPLTDRQKQVRSLIAQGILKTVSIGFIPKEIRPASFDDQGNIIEPMTIAKSELLELSVVAVPANAGALFDMKGFNNELQSFSQLAKAVTVESKGIEELTEAQMDELKELLKGIEDRLKAIGNDIKSIGEGQETFQKQVMDKLDAPGKGGDKPPKDEDEDDEEKKSLKSSVKEITEQNEKLAKQLGELADKFGEVLKDRDSQD